MYIKTGKQLLIEGYLPRIRENERFIADYMQFVQPDHCNMGTANPGFFGLVFPPILQYPDCPAAQGVDLYRVKMTVEIEIQEPGDRGRDARPLNNPLQSP